MKWRRSGEGGMNVFSRIMEWKIIQEVYGKVEPMDSPAEYFIDKIGGTNAKQLWNFLHLSFF